MNDASETTKTGKTRAKRGPQGPKTMWAMFATEEARNGFKGVTTKPIDVIKATTSGDVKAVVEIERPSGR